MDNLLHFLSIVLILYCVYQLGSLAGLFSERAGVGNIALDGNMIFSAVVFAIFYENLLQSFDGLIFITIVASLMLTIPISICWMMILAILVNRYQANHFIAGTGMNIVAPALALLLYAVCSINTNGTILHKFTFTIADWNIGIKTSNGINNDLNWFVIGFVGLTILITIASSFLINRTSFGLSLISTGENPYAVETSGVSVNLTKYIALAISGALCGLAASVFLMKGPYQFTVEGSGFLSLGVLILGKYKIKGTIFASITMAVLIGFFQTIPYIIGFDNESLVELTYLFKIFPFLIPIIGMIIFRNNNFPAAVGQNFKKDQR